jgi:hypothetical protein
MKAKVIEIKSTDDSNKFDVLAIIQAEQYKFTLTVVVDTIANQEIHITNGDDFFETKFLSHPRVATGIAKLVSNFYAGLAVELPALVDDFAPEINPLVPAQFSKEEIARRGEELYENSIRTQVEIPENIGKIISINIDTGDFEIDQDLILACQRLKAKHSNAALWTERIGYDAVYAVGGTLVRTAQ